MLEGELGEVGHTAEEGGDGVGTELVLAEEEIDQVEVLERLVDVSGELVVRQVEVGQGLQMLDGAGDGSTERVLVKGEVGELVLLAGDLGDQTSQIVVVQVQDGKVLVVEKGGGDGTAELIVGQVQLLELGPSGEGRVRKRLGEEVVLQIHVLEGVEVLDVVEVALHLVVIDGEELEVGQLLEAGRDLALDHVVGKDNDAEVGHGMEGIGERSGDVEVVLQGKDAEVGELLELLGDGAGHVVVGEPDLTDGALVGSALAVGAPEVNLFALGVNLVPLALVLAGEEGEGVEPRVSLGGVVEGGQGVALDELAGLGGAEVLGVRRDRNSEGVLLADPLKGLVLGSTGGGHVVLEGDAGRHEEGPGGLLALGIRHLRGGGRGRPRWGGGRSGWAGHGRRRCDRLSAAPRAGLGFGYRHADDETNQNQSQEDGAVQVALLPTALRLVGIGGKGLVRPHLLNGGKLRSVGAVPLQIDVVHVRRVGGCHVLFVVHLDVVVLRFNCNKSNKFSVQSRKYDRYAQKVHEMCCAEGEQCG